ncbi:uncharacterized protein BYT42DRAFT_486692, partial [Radiomyces spectabilis]|uniref:uncharacterized protein n=1 Tax=Radiomyces spectabilis TaxID=64574 RepID=UPI0022201F8C
DSATFRKSDFSFLDDLHQIIGLVLTGNHQYEVGKAVAQLDERFENARRVLNELPGLQYVKEEQEEILRRELATLATKKKQLDNYLALSPLQ